MMKISKVLEVFLGVSMRRGSHGDNWSISYNICDSDFFEFGVYIGIWFLVL
jgi:hypothetical protein